MNTGENKPRVLIHAYGNPGRGDDGIGATFVQMCQPWLTHETSHHLTIKTTFQLSVEDSYTMSEYDIVVYIDASLDEEGPYTFTAVEPAPRSPFATHTMTPGGTLFLCRELYGRQPETYLLRIKGYEWGMTEGLSEQAEKNMWHTFPFFRSKLQEWIALEKAHDHLHQ